MTLKEFKSGIYSNAAYDVLKQLFFGTILTVLVDLAHTHFPVLDINRSSLVIITTLLFLYVVILRKIYKFGRNKYELFSNSGLFYFRRNLTDEDKTQNASYLKDKIKRSKDIQILGATGYNTFAKKDSSGNAFLREALEASTGEIKIMLLHPCSLQAKVRANSLGVTLRSYQDEILESIEFLHELKNKGKPVALKLYTQKPIWKMIVLDDTLWLQYYNPNKHVEHMPVYGLSRNSQEHNYNLFDPLYSVFLKKWQFDNNPIYDFDLEKLVHKDGSQEQLRDSIDKGLVLS